MSRSRHKPGSRPAHKNKWAGSDALLIGGDGMLGRAMASELRRRSLRYLAPPQSELDLTDDAWFERAGWTPLGGPPLVINCAGWTDVDGAEAHEEEALRVNGNGTAALVQLCFGGESQLVTFGTDYVFDGSATSPYPIDHPRRPLNAYGRSKAAGEEALETPRRGDCLHIRTSWMYAPWGKNFVRTIAKAAWEKPVLRVVNDQRGRPTSAEHLARVTLDLIERDAEGIWHVTDGGGCTWYEFAKEIVRLTGAPARVEPCTSAEYPRPAKRPAYSVLDISETERVLGPMPDWRENLADVVRRLEA